MNSENLDRKRKPLFLPKNDLRTLRDKIKRLRAQGNLGYEDQVRLDQLQTVSRRDFLRKVGLGGAAIVSGLALRKWVSPERSVESVPKSVLPRPAEQKPVSPPEMVEIKPEQEPQNFKEGICFLISRYNALLEGASDRQLKEGLGEKGFVDVYAQMVGELKGKVDFPQITLTDFDSLDGILLKIHVLEDLAEKEGYYLRMMPFTSPLTTTQESVKSVLMIFGKKVTEQKRTVSRNGKSNEYLHIVVDKENSDETNKMYETAQARLSAFTYQRDENSPFKVVQLKWGYAISAKTKFDKLQHEPRSENDFANQVVLREYRTKPESVAVKNLADRIMESSWHHEEQHVLDEFPSDIEQSQGTNEELLVFKVLTEVRGLLAPVAKKDPKMGVLNIYAWMESGDLLSQLMAKEAANILHDVSGRDIFNLISLSDQELNRIGALALEGNDILFDALLVKKVPIESQQAQEAQAAFYVFAEEARSRKRNPK